LDAMNRRRKARDKQPPLRVCEDFVELPAHRTLAGRVALALDVGGVLKQRQYPGFAVLGEGVQIEKFVVGRRWIDFEIAGVNDDSQRRVNGERHAIDQAMRHANGMNREDSSLE